MNRKRKCFTCGYEFWAEPGQEFCSALCAGNVAVASVVLALRRFADGLRSV